MGKKFNVILSEGFLKGSENTTFFRDFPNCTTEDIKALSNFIEKVKSGEPLPGKNKPSWLDDNQRDIPDTSLYKEYGYWHYHAGLEYPQNKFSMTHDLKLNLYGATSPNVIHYTNDGTIVTIEAYSPVHDPFPKSDDHNNPLFPVDE